MSGKQFTFEFLEKNIRMKTFGILGTVSVKGTPHSTGIVYGVSHPDSRFSLFILTNEKYKKVRNLNHNPNISLVIPFPHYYLRFVPSSCIYFQGTAEMLPFNYPEAQKAFKEKRILKLMLSQAIQEKKEQDSLFLRIIPNKKIFCYGLGFSLRELRRHRSGSYNVIIPDERL